MNDNYIVGLFTGLIPLVFLLIGHISGRKLPQNLRKLRFRRFAAIGLSVMVFALTINRPFVSSYSFANTNESKIYPPSETEEIKEFQKEQSASVYFLKREVAELKSDLYKVNKYYGDVTQFLSISIIAMLWLFVIYSKPEEQKEELETIQTDKIFKL